MNMDSNDKNQQVSKYNDAVNSISRLNNMWLACRLYRLHGRYSLWKIELDNLWDELYSDILKQKNNDVLKLKNKRCMIKIAKSTTKSSLYFSLIERQHFLIEIQSIAGKAGVYVDENEGYEG